MDSSPSPEQPENKQEERQEVLTAAQWLKEQISVPQERTISSIGEFLLPTLLGIMESCWIVAVFIGLAGVGLFGSSAPLLPLWAPFILIVGSIWLFYYAARQGAKKGASSQNETAKIAVPDTSLFIILVGVLSLFFVWLHIYAQTAFVFDPKWLLALLNDILLLNIHFYEVVTIIGLSFLLGWQGIRLLNRDIEPSNVFRTLWLGLGIMTAVIILRTAQERAGVVFHDNLILLLLIPFFLFFSLATHALARVVFIRHSHFTGLQGSVVAQERAIILVIGSLGLILLLVALLVSSTVNPSFWQTLAPLGAALARAYNWLVGVIANLAGLIAIPFLWLFELFGRLFPAKARNTPNTQSNISKPKVSPPHPLPFAATLLTVIKFLLPILVLSLIFVLIWWTLRRRRVRRRANRQDQDIHESLWSWSLFWTQLKAILRALFARFFARDATIEDSVAVPEEIKGEPTARSMREIYRALLKKAASHGYSRKKFETPYEFKQRLDEKVPLAEPQLEVITEAYTLTRYGGDAPDEAQLELVRSRWAELDQKWV
jgi:hypothetical protein